MSSDGVALSFPGNAPIAIRRWKAAVGDLVSQGSVLFLYVLAGGADGGGGELKFRCDRVGTLQQIVAGEGALVAPSGPLAVIGLCKHPTVMKDLCAECGADLRLSSAGGGGDDEAASVAMLHSIPELRVSRRQAEALGREDVARLLRQRKLVLLVDLDQTLVHTTNDQVPPQMPDVFHFQLYGADSPWYHTRLRPGTRRFLQRVARCFELHICTFGVRLYAHTITRFLDPDGVYFSQRILSRDECFSAHSKTANLKALFPCGEHMVCIIDDREDVWNFAPNLVHVKPYHFFRHTGDINAPPGLEKAENDDKEGVDFDLMRREQQPPATTAASAGSERAGNSDDTERGVQRRDSMPNLSEDEDEVASDGDTGHDLHTESTGDGATATPASKPPENMEELNADLSLSEDETEEDTGSEQPQNVASETDDFAPKAGSANSNDAATDLKTEACDSQTEASNSQTDVPVSKTEAPDSNMEASDSKTAVSNSKTETSDSMMEASSSKTEARDSKTSDGNPEEDSVPLQTGMGDKRGVDAASPSTSDASNSSSSGSLSSAPTAAATAAAEHSPVEVDDPDDYLLHLEDILLRIHAIFYDMLDKSRAPSSSDTGATSNAQQDVEEEALAGAEAPDLRLMVPYVRRKVLRGVRLVFSGVVPSSVPLHDSRAYHVATSLGAGVHERIVRRGPRHTLTTHLVAARLGTAKTNEAARCRRVRVVTPDWLWCCAERWERVDERLFPLSATTVTVTRQPPAHCSSPDPHRPHRPHHPHPPRHSQTRQFQESLNPLLAFSPDDIARMDEEVEDILQSESDDEQAAASSASARPPPPAGSTVLQRMARKRHAPDNDDDDEEEMCEDDEGVSEEEQEEEQQWSTLKFSRSRTRRSDDEDLGNDGNCDSEDSGPDLEENLSMMGAELERELGTE